MLFASHTYASRPIATAPRLPRPFKRASDTGEYGWAAWSFSRVGKINAWAWHGLGTAKLYAWAVLSNKVYVRKDGDSGLHLMQPDTYLAPSATNTDSPTVEAVTQWLDFGKPGQTKALTGIDADMKNVRTIEIYVSINGDRTGTLAESIDIGSNAGGWTYNGEIIPLNVAATEFKLRLIGESNTECQVNRFTLHWEEVQA